VRVIGTKTRTEREDEEAERLIRPSPKMKPPRRDLRRNTVLETERDLERDLVREDEDEVTKEARVILRQLCASSDTDLVKVRRKEDDKVVNVSKETLKQDSASYDEVKEEEGSGLSESGLKHVTDLLSKAKEDPKFEEVLKSFFKPEGLGGVVKSNPSYDVGNFKALGIPKGQLTAKDLVDALTPHMNSRGLMQGPGTKPPKKPKKKPTEEPSEKAPEEKSPEEEPTKSPEEKAPEEKSPEEEPTKSPEEKPTEEPKKKKPADKPTKPEKPADKPTKPEKPADKPTKPEKPEKPEKKPVKRRKFSESEQFEARKRLYAALPNKLATKFFDAHPDDINDLVSSYKGMKLEGGAAKLLQEPGGLEKAATHYTLDPEQVTPPTEVTVKGEVVRLDSLPEMDRDREIAKHRAKVVGANLAIRSAAIKDLRKSGVPGKLATQSIDATLRALRLPTGGPREAQIRKDASKLFLNSSAPLKVHTTSGRFGDQEGETVYETTPKQKRTKTLKNLKPTQKVLVESIYAGEDFAFAMAKFGPKPGDKHNDLIQKITKAATFFAERQTTLDSTLNPYRTFLGRIREGLKDKHSAGGRRVLEEIAKHEHGNYKAQQRRHLKTDKSKATPYRSNSQSNSLPGLSEAPTPPDTVPIRNESESFEALKSLLKVASFYSPYSSLKGSGNNAGVYSMDKKAKQAANEALQGLDLVASVIEKNQEKWGLDFKLAKTLVNQLDKIADGLESGFFGEDSLLARQAELLKKEGALLEGDSDEKDYMSAFETPSDVIEGDSDEKGYMSLFDDDQTEAVNEVA